MTVKVQKAQVVINDDDSNSSASENDQDASQEESDNVENEQIDAESAELLNAGWADSIAKVLKMNKPKKKKSLVLSKAKKLNEAKITQKVVQSSYEVAAENGKVKRELIVKEDKETEVPVIKKKKRDLPNLRVKPNILEKDRERIFQKIATRGVVQLFNAVKTQQKDINKQLEEAGPLEVRKEKVLKNIDKRAFLDVLMGEKSTKIDDKIKEQSKKKTEKDHSKKPSEWSVLRDDFMMSAKMKDWDKEMEGEEEESEIEMEVESD